MRLALVALVLSSSAAAPAALQGPSGAGQLAALAPLCGQDLKVRPVRTPEGVRAKRLGELPAGNLTLTVLNRVGGCIEPVIVRQGYGALGGR